MGPEAQSATYEKTEQSQQKTDNADRTKELQQFQERNAQSKLLQQCGNAFGDNSMIYYKALVNHAHSQGRDSSQKADFFSYCQNNLQKGTDTKSFIADTKQRTPKNSLTAVSPTGETVSFIGKQSLDDSSSTTSEGFTVYTPDGEAVSTSFVDARMNTDEPIQEISEVAYTSETLESVSYSVSATLEDSDEPTKEISASDVQELESSSGYATGVVEDIDSPIQEMSASSVQERESSSGFVTGTVEDIEVPSSPVVGMTRSAEKARQTA